MRIIQEKKKSEQVMELTLRMKLWIAHKNNSVEASYVNLLNGILIIQVIVMYA